MNESVVIERKHFPTLLMALRQRGYRIIGPKIRDGAVVYGELTSGADLPEGWADLQERGSYRLQRRNDKALFGYAVGPHSWKRFLYLPEIRLWQAVARGNGFDMPSPFKIRY